MTHAVNETSELLANLFQVAGDDYDLVREVVQIFLRESPGRLRNLAEAIDEGDPVAVANHAHSLKGSTASIGIEAMRSLSENLEHGARKGVLEEAPGNLAALQNEFERVRPVLEEVASSRQVA